MNRILFILIFNLLWTVLNAQTDRLASSVPTSKPEKIANARRELMASFLRNDLAGAGLWMDSLARLEDDQYAGLIWDERWMLYYWMESYGTLLEEAATMNQDQRNIQSWKAQPPKDSLFEILDDYLYQKRFDCFTNIQNAFLNQEEKAFAMLLFEYLLRLNTAEEEWAERLQSFENHYPSSRFFAFVSSIKPSILKPSNKALGISGGLSIGNWTGPIERTLATPYTFNVDLYYWMKRWNFLFDGSFGGPSLTRDLYVGQDIWPKDDPSSFFNFGLGIGYDIVNSPKLRIFPSIGAGAGFLRPPAPGEDEEPLPAYYDSFYFNEFHLAAAINADIKLFTKHYRDWNTPKGSYHGIRLKFGWNGLNFGKQNPELSGQLFFVAVNYNFFGYLTK